MTDGVPPGRPDVAIPILPSADFGRTAEVYGAMGFGVALRTPEGGEGYMILVRGTAELHFFESPGTDPATNDHGAYLRVADADAWAAVAPAPPSVRMLQPVADRPWGMREFALIDPDGNLIRIGHPLPAG